MQGQSANQRPKSNHRKRAQLKKVAFFMDLEQCNKTQKNEGPVYSFRPLNQFGF